MQKAKGDDKGGGKGGDEGGGGVGGGGKGGVGGGGGGGDDGGQTSSCKYFVLQIRSAPWQCVRLKKQQVELRKGTGGAQCISAQSPNSKHACWHCSTVIPVCTAQMPQPLSHCLKCHR